MIYNRWCVSILREYTILKAFIISSLPGSTRLETIILQHSPVSSTATIYRLHTDGGRSVAISQVTKDCLQALLCRRHFRALEYTKCGGGATAQLWYDLFMFSERIEGTRVKEIRLYQVIAIEASFKIKRKDKHCESCNKTFNS